MDSEPQAKLAVASYAPRPLSIGALPLTGSLIAWYSAGALLCMAFGVAAFFVPFLVAGRGWALNTDGVFLFLRSVMNRGTREALIYYAVLAFAVGLIRRFPLGMVGPFMMLPFVASMIDDMVRGTGPNLFPIVVLVYLALAIGGSICAVFGRFARMSVDSLYVSFIRRAREA